MKFPTAICSLLSDFLFGDDVYQLTYSHRQRNWNHMCFFPPNDDEMIYEFSVKTFPKQRETILKKTSDDNVLTSYWI